MNTASHLSDEQLSIHVDSALDARQSAAVADHLFTCAECARRMELMRATSRAVAGLPELEPPRALDLAFTRELVRSGGLFGFLRRPPAWVVPMVAAAALLAVAVTVAPNLNRPRSTAGGTALQQAGSGPPSGGSAFEDRSGPAVAPAPAPNINGAPGAASMARVNDVTLTLTFDRQQAAAGQAVRVTLTATGGSAEHQLDPRGLTLQVDSGGDRTQLGGLQGEGLKLGAHGTLTFAYSWSAGGSPGNPSPGIYNLSARLYLSDGSVLTVTQSYTVS